MNQLLFERLVGNIDQRNFARLHTTKLLHSFGAAPHHRFDGGEQGTVIYAGTPAPSPSLVAGESDRRTIWAHQAGVNALALERFDGRILISGGSDGTIRLWDLEQCSSPHRSHTYRCIGEIIRASGAQTTSLAPVVGRGGSGGGGGSSNNHNRSSNQLQAAPPQHHRFGITHLSFYPFDSAAFLSSSYDQSLKVWATDHVRLSGSFELGAKVYTHATSPIASHLLVACATQHPAVRLVDLRSGAAVQSLLAPGQIGAATGAVLSAAWSPRHEHVLASGAVDGTVRVWDIRRSSGLIALLDHEDSLGILRRRPDIYGAGGAGVGGGSLSERGIRASAKAHAGPVNGLAWTDDGDYIVSAGHDRRIRVWDAATGANTLVNFGPAIRNGGLMSVTGMFASPTGLTLAKGNVLFWPNENEILVLDMHEGTVITKLRGVGAEFAAVRRGGGASSGGGGLGSERTIRNRVTSLVWRGAGGFGSSSGVVMGGRNAAGGIYSGHLDGRIRCWMPELEGPDEEFEDPKADGGRDTDEVRRKRKAIDDAYRSLMGKEIKFS